MSARSAAADAADDLAAAGAVAALLAILLAGAMAYWTKVLARARRAGCCLVAWFGHGR